MLRTEKGRLLLKHLPRNVILTETDGPFISNSGIPLLPSQVQMTINQIAQIWEVREDEVSEQIYENFKYLINNT